MNLTTIQMVVSKNKSAILTGMAMASSALAVVAACQATWEAKEVLDEMHYKSETEPTVQEKIIAVAPLYWKVILFLAIAELGAFGAQKENDKIIAAMTTALSMKEKELENNADAVKAIFGDKKAEQVEKESARQSILKNPPNAEDIDDTGTGGTLFYDGTCGGYFRADPEFVKSVFNEFNNQLSINDRCGDNIVSADDLMRRMNRTSADVFEKLVWLPGDSLNPRVYIYDFSASEDLFDLSGKEFKDVIWTIKYTDPREIFDKDM